ncbi:MAG: hypothetical protein ACOC9T_00060 [Myxococcota bacterium]
MTSTFEPTRYEVTVEHADGRRYLIAYTPRRSQVGILDAIEGIWDAWREVVLEGIGAR